MKPLLWAAVIVLTTQSAHADRRVADPGLGMSIELPAGAELVSSTTPLSKRFLLKSGGELLLSKVVGPNNTAERSGNELAREFSKELRGSIPGLKLKAKKVQQRGQRRRTRYHWSFQGRYRVAQAPWHLCGRVEISRSRVWLAVVRKPGKKMTQECTSLASSMEVL